MVLRDIEEKLRIPEDVEIILDHHTIKVKGPKGENQRKLLHPKVKISNHNGFIILESKKPTKREKKVVNTFKAHIKNMIKGVRHKFIYKIKICSGHFPINVSTEGHFLIIKNFFGEKKDRKTKIIEGVDVKINGDIISIEGVDKEKVGQTAANIEQCTRRCGFDRRIYQDGCWIIEKDGKKQK